MTRSIRFDRKQWRRVARLVCLWLAVVVAPIPARAEAEWTIMVYMDADNNLEWFGLQDFLEMAEVGSDENVNIVVQFDRIPGYSVDYGDWSGTKRFLVGQGMIPTPENAVMDIGEANMGDPDTLRNFIDWATTFYPASRYSLILWDHGFGWRDRIDALSKTMISTLSLEVFSEAAEELGTLLEFTPYKAVCLDDTDGSDSLSLKELRDAMVAAWADIDLLGFDACLMGMVEVAYEIRDSGPEIMVASEAWEPAQGWPYEAILDGLTTYPEWQPAEFARWVVDQYALAYGNEETLAGVDLSAMQSLGDAVGHFAMAMIDYWYSDEDVVRDAALRVVNVFDSAVVINHSGSEYPGANGLSVYFPELNLDPEYNSQVVDFSQNANWAMFLDSFSREMGDSWISLARESSQVFNGEPFVDLRDFSSRVASSNNPCSYSVTPLIRSFSVAGGSLDIVVTALDPGCTWTVSENVDWITPSASQGSGNTTLTLSVPPNLDARRSAAITVAGTRIQILQTGNDAARDALRVFPPILQLLLPFGE